MFPETKSMAVRDTRRRSSLLKNVYLSHDLELY